MRRLRLLAAASLMGLMVALQPLPGARTAHAESTQISDQNRTTLQGLADALHGQDQTIRTLLIQLGFPPKNAPATWRQWAYWPSVRMLETAYVSAEASRTGSGRDLLNKMARLIAAQHTEAIRYEPSLAQAFHEAAGAPIVEPVTPFGFGLPSLGQLNAQLPPDIRSQIEIISRYTETIHRPYLFGRCCSLSEDESYDVLRHQPDDRSALEAAIKLKAPPPTDEQKMSRLVDTVLADNPSLGLEPGLSARFHPTTPNVREVPPGSADDAASKAVHDLLLPVLAARSPPGPGPDRPISDTNPSVPPADHPSAALQVGPAPEPRSPPPGPQRNRGGAPVSRAGAEDSYRVFRESNYPARAGAPAWTYGRTVARAIGFGGVIFGNKVTASPGLPPAGSVSWSPSKTAAAPTSPDVREDWGRLIFRLGDGRVLASHEMRADTAGAGKAIVFDHPVIAKDAGVGLVGFTGRFVVASIGGTAGMDRLEQGLSFVVHPDVTATRLGHSMMLLDTLPMISDRFVKQVSDAGVAGQDLKIIQDIFGEKYGKLGQYKFTDVELKIIPQPGGMIAVQRADCGTSQIDGQSCEKAYMTMLSFDGDKPRAEKAIPIYPMMPTLVQTSDPFARANEFAEVFALLRWAQASGAMWLGSPPPPQSVSSSTALLIGSEDGITFVRSAATSQEGMADDVFAKAKAIAKVSGSTELARLTDDLHARVGRILALREAGRIAGSPQEMLSAAFFADPEMARHNREAADKAVAAASFDADGETSGRREASIHWIQDHIDQLDRLVPGVKARQDLQDRASAEIGQMAEVLDDPSGLIISLIGPERARSLLAKVRAETPKKETTTPGDDAAERMMAEVDRMVPGLSKWLLLETILGHVIVAVEPSDL